MFDNRGEDILSHMSEAFNFIEHSQHYGNILVHCHKGISRSATFVIGYLMKKNEMTLDEALTYVKSCRPIVSPNESFLEQLSEFESNLNQDREIATADATSDNLGPPNLQVTVDIGPLIPESISFKELPSGSSEMLISSKVETVNLDSLGQSIEIKSLSQDPTVLIKCQEDLVSDNEHQPKRSRSAL